MQLSVDILDYIFGFLRSHKRTLIACSADPVLSPIVERHIYHHIIVQINGTLITPDSDYSFTPNHISQLVSKNPHITNHVRILQITYHPMWQQSRQYLGVIFDGFAKTLLMFPLLESIKLTTTEEPIWVKLSTVKGRGWCWTPAFQAALEDRLSLPTVKEIHFIGGEDFPFSFFGHCKNIQNLSLSGQFKAEECQLYGFTLPRLKSLTLRLHSISPSCLAWLKLQVKEVESLKFVLSSAELLSELLGVCSGALKKLEIDFADSRYCDVDTAFCGIEFDASTNPLLERSFLGIMTPNLQQLTIRTAVDMFYYDHLNYTLGGWRSWLPGTAKIINVFMSSVQHLVLDFDIRPDIIPRCALSDLDHIELSPLNVLGAASLTIPRIDLNIHMRSHADDSIRAKLVSVLLERYKDDDVMRSINEGVLVIHSDQSFEDSFLIQADN